MDLLGIKSEPIVKKFAVYIDETTKVVYLIPAKYLLYCVQEGQNTSMAIFRYVCEVPPSQLLSKVKELGKGKYIYGQNYRLYVYFYDQKYSDTYNDLLHVHIKDKTELFNPFKSNHQNKYLSIMDASTGYEKKLAIQTPKFPGMESFIKLGAKGFVHLVDNPGMNDIRVGTFDKPQDDFLKTRTTKIGTLERASRIRASMQ